MYLMYTGSDLYSYYHWCYSRLYSTQLTLSNSCLLSSHYTSYDLYMRYNLQTLLVHMYPLHILLDTQNSHWCHSNPH